VRNAAHASAVVTRAADADGRIRPVKVGIIDVGSNSVRLLVASVTENGCVEQLHRERVYLRLGDDVYELGKVGAAKLEEASGVARTYARAARKAGAERLQTIVTAPGRQAGNAEKLVRVLSKATRAPVVVLGGGDEGRLAWEGAVSRMDDPSEVVAVADLGGGSCELAVGTPTLGPAWVRSLDAGALRVTRTYLDGSPPTPESLVTARHEIGRLFADLEPPRSDAAIVVGGTARAIGRIVGRRYGAAELDTLVDTLSRTPPAFAIEEHGVTPERAETLLGGTLVLTEIARRLGTDLEVGRGGLREGAALALARAEAAAA
jgi:exopolyphosphatase/guanosine-5'-triphosphate,3'-diphosphate pyrophosphatase